MKLKILVTLFTLTIAANAISQERETYSFNLRECIDYALENSYDIKNARLDVQIGKRQVKETIGIGLPQVNGELSYMNNFAIQTVFLPAVFFDSNAEPGAPAVPVRFGVQHTSTAGINVSQILFDGSYLVGLQAANVYQELSKRSKEATEEDIAANVMKAYYGVLIAKERLDLMQANFYRLDTLLSETRIMQ
ncbi:MAG: TolC family protein, partial [Cyclobacteriaceae bacterium]